MGKRIFIGSDHAGYELKNSLKQYLNSNGYEVVDVGPYDYDQHDDYPESIIPAAEKAVENGCPGIVLGHSGQGEAIAANKVEGARAALYYGRDIDIIELSKEHNNANILSLGAGFLSKDEAIRAVETWLDTSFTGEDRHQRRLQEISRYEQRKKPQVLPAILANNQKEIEEEFKKVLEYSRWFHIDVEDGKFVENTSLDFEFQLPENQRYEAHLMVKSPLEWIKNHLETFMRFNFHIETVENPGKIIEFLHENDKEVGIAVKPGTSIESVMPYILKVDVIQLMTVEPGSYGNEFHDEMIDRIEQISKKNPEVTIEVDGHVNDQNIEELKEAGANMFVSGSFVQESQDPGKAIRKLEKLIEAG
jgi:ribose 5-phosphate isomerase B